MAEWWNGNADEPYWVEIRREPGIGTSLDCPNRDERGRRNPWWELVRSVKRGEIVYHWSANEGRFVGRSVVAKHPEVHDEADGYYHVELEDFSPVPVEVSLQDIRSLATVIYGLRDELQANHSGPLYLPFQFTQDRAQLRFMSNYFAKLPAKLVAAFFGEDGLGLSRVPIAEEAEHERDGSGPVLPRLEAIPSRAYLSPFRAKADTNYLVRLAGGRHKRSRRHETLVNACAKWLEDRGLTPARNAAIDLGLLDGSVIIEAKVVGGSWATAIRQALGQLYEYRYFKVANPSAELIFLADRAVPIDWLHFLESDRGVGAMWPTKTGFHTSSRADRAFPRATS